MTAPPRLLLTMGDVAGIGPEILARAWPDLLPLCRPVVVGDAEWMRRALELVRRRAEVRVVERPDEVEPTAGLIPCFMPSNINLGDIKPGKVSGAAGRAAYEFLCAGMDWVLGGAAHGLVTCPLHKEGLKAAGLSYPGHTEILAERAGAKHFGMMLYGRGPHLPHGLGVVHATLHLSLREAVSHLSTATVLEKIRLLDRGLRALVEGQPRIGVAALNPHASDGGLFGDEETRIIQPAAAQAQNEGITVTGPWPSDTLFVRAQRGEFDGIVAMYHDQGHIPMKLLAGFSAVNVTLGLPFVRTSVAHGTAYDIAGQGRADPTSLIEATRLAALLTARKLPSAEHSVLATPRGE